MKKTEEEWNKERIDLVDDANFNAQYREAVKIYDANKRAEEIIKALNDS